MLDRACRVLHLFRGVLGLFVIRKGDARLSQTYSTAKHSGATDEDGDHGSLTKTAWEGPSGGLEGLGSWATPARRAQTWRTRKVSSFIED